MKNLNYLNYFFVGMPFGLCLFALINIEFIIFGVLSTILTGLFQVVIAINLLIEEPEDRNLKAYIIGVLLFFTLLFFGPTFTFEYKIYLFVTVPPILAIYLSVLIYKKAQQ